MSVFHEKNRGTIKISYEILALILGLKIGSIKSVQNNQSGEMMYIFHDDEDKGATLIAEGQSPIAMTWPIHR